MYIFLVLFFLFFVVVVGEMASTRLDIPMASSSFVEGNIIVKSCEISEVVVRDHIIDHETMENSFAGILIGTRKEKNKSAWAYKMELARAVEREDYEKAKEIKDIMDSLNMPVK